MTEIVPAIIATTREELISKIELARSFAPLVQIDVGDGIFVASTTWPYGGGSPLDLQKYAGSLEMEVHLMIDQPETTIRDWVASGVRRIIVHQEATKEFGLVADVVRDAGHELGIALKLETPISTLDSWMEHVRVVQLMGIAEIGFYGHAFEEEALPKIEALRIKYPDVIIEVDGGVTRENAARLAALGVNRIVVGSGIFRTDDPQKAYKEFVTIVSPDGTH